MFGSGSKGKLGPESKDIKSHCVSRNHGKKYKKRKFKKKKPKIVTILGLSSGPLSTSTLSCSRHRHGPQHLQFTNLKLCPIQQRLPAPPQPLPPPTPSSASSSAWNRTVLVLGRLTSQRVVSPGCIHVARGAAWPPFRG